MYGLECDTLCTLFRACRQITKCTTYNGRLIDSSDRRNFRDELCQLWWVPSDTKKPILGPLTRLARITAYSLQPEKLDLADTLYQMGETSESILMFKAAFAKAKSFHRTTIRKSQFVAWAEHDAFLAVQSEAYDYCLPKIPGAYKNLHRSALVNLLQQSDPNNVFPGESMSLVEFAQFFTNLLDPRSLLRQYSSYKFGETSPSADDWENYRIYISIIAMCEI